MLAQFLRCLQPGLFTNDYAVLDSDRTAGLRESGRDSLALYDARITFDNGHAALNTH
jgi:hypothetical protein